MAERVQKYENLKWDVLKEKSKTDIKNNKKRQKMKEILKEERKLYDEFE